MHSKKSKITGLLHKGFKPDKCKTSIKMGMARIKLMRNKRDVQLKQMRREVAQLLESGQEQTARIRVEHVIREEKTIAAYEFLELYCELIVSRLHIIDSQKTCPIDLKEAIASLVFAAPRCADIPELSDVKSQFQSKYGKDFIISSLEVRPDSGVARMVVEKLSAVAPDIETKVKVLKAIAEENNITWDPKGFEDNLKKPQSEKLGGSSKIYSSSEMAQKVPFQPAPPPGIYQPPNQMPAYYDTKIDYNTTTNSSNNTPQTGPTNENSSPIPPPTTHVRTPSSSKPSEPEGDLRPEKTGEYLTVEEAAEAAAKSAQMASKAAKAAADMARQESLSRHPSLSSSPKNSFRRNSEVHSVSKPVREESLRARPNPKSEGSVRAEVAPPSMTSLEVDSASKPVRKDSLKARPNPNPKAEVMAEVAPPSQCHSSDDDDVIEPPKVDERRRVDKSQSSVSKRKGVVKREEEEINTNQNKKEEEEEEEDHYSRVNSVKHKKQEKTESYSSFNSAKYKEQEKAESYSGFNTTQYKEEEKEAHNSSFNTVKYKEEEEEDHYSVFNTQYQKSASKGSNKSFGKGTAWDYHEEITSPKTTFDPVSIFFDEPNKIDPFEIESSSKYKREDSSSNKKKANFPFDDVTIPSPKPSRIDSGSKFSFDSVPSPKPAFNDSVLSPKASRHGSAFNDEPSLLSYLSTGAPVPVEFDHKPKFDSDADLKLGLESPKFDSGPNFDNGDYSDHEYEKAIEKKEVKIVEDVSYKRSSQSSSLFNSKEKEKEVISSSDERIIKPMSMRTKNPIRKGPLKYSPKEEIKDSSNSDESDSDDQQVLNYEYKFGGRKNRVGNPYAAPPYIKSSLNEPKPSKSQPYLDGPKPSKSKPYFDEPKPSKSKPYLDEPKPSKSKPVRLSEIGDQSVEEKRFNKPKQSRYEMGSDSDENDDDYESPTSYQNFKNLRGKKEENIGSRAERIPKKSYNSGSDYQDEIYNKPVEKPRKEIPIGTRRNTKEESFRYNFNQIDSDEEIDEEKEYEPAPPLVSRKRTDLRSQNKPIKEQTKITKEYDDDLYNNPRKEIPKKPFKYSPNYTNSDEEEEEEKEEKIIRNKPSSARRNSRESVNHNLSNSDEEEKEERIPVRRTEKSPVRIKPSTEQRIPQSKRTPVYEEEDEEEERIPARRTEKSPVRIKPSTEKRIPQPKRTPVYEEKEKEERIPVRRADKSPVEIRPSTEKRIPEPKRTPVYEEEEKVEKIQVTTSLPTESSGVPQKVKQNLNLDNKDKKKQEEPEASEKTKSESEEEESEEEDLPPRLLSFPLDMDSLRARVKEIQATMR